MTGVSGTCGPPSAQFFLGIRYGPELYPYFDFAKTDGNQDLSGTYSLVPFNEYGGLDTTVENYEFHLLIHDMGYAYFNNYQVHIYFVIYSLYDKINSFAS